MTIEQFLKNWKSESLFGERHFQKQNFSLVAGQELYLLSFKSIVSVDGESKLIEKHKFFQTRVQGLEISDEINLKADIYICQNILTQLENDFFEEYNNFIDNEVKKKTSP